MTQADLFAPPAPVQIDTPQQVAVLDHFRDGTGDLCGTARAGAGKTSTIIKGIAVRPRRSRAMLCAFSKLIADELAARIKSNGDPWAEARTLHAVGNRAITRALGRQVPNSRRELELAVRFCGEESEAVEEIAKLAALAKESAPEAADDIDRLEEIALDFGLAGDEEDDKGWSITARAGAAAEVVRASLQPTGAISFSDMLYLPLALDLQPDQYDLVVVDEAQDLSESQLRLAARMRAPGGRIVVVGDPRQAIFSWRGAAPGALERTAQQLRAKRLALTVSFRCGRAIIAEARQIVPDIEAAPGAAQGRVWRCGETQLPTLAQPGDFILSRTNAPLARTCLAILRQGKRARIAGRDLAGGLIKLISNLGRGGATLDVFRVRLEGWREREVARAVAAKRQARADLVADQADMIAEIARDAQTVDGLIAFIRRLFDDTDTAPRVTCSTIHRAKGLEADRVFVLQETLDAMRPSTPLEEVEEANLKYVAITRARRELIWTT
jgi:DNA helicase-2/ATP-dependent DNA helicase PcrA